MTKKEKMLKIISDIKSIPGDNMFKDFINTILSINSKQNSRILISMSTHQEYFIDVYIDSPILVFSYNLEEEPMIQIRNSDLKNHTKFTFSPAYIKNITFKDMSYEFDYLDNKIKLDVICI